MPKPSPAPIPDLPILRVQPVERLDRERPTAFRVALTTEELRAAAQFLDVERIDRLALRGTLAAWGPRGWLAQGRLTATVVQPCVVTLAPVVTQIDEPVERRYLPQHDLPEVKALEHELAEDEIDPPDPFTDSLDLGQLAIESLALLIDPYPRAPGAELGERLYTAPGVEPMTEQDAKPFAALAALRLKLGEALD